jgi:two-component system heavy metal sensor histidine kinase CusS
MPSASDGFLGRLRRVAARIDVRLTLLLAGAGAAFTSVLLCGLLVYAVKEAFEEQVAMADGWVAHVDDAAARGVDLDALPPGGAYRVVDAAGRERTAGRWPEAQTLRREVSAWNAVLARAGDSFVREHVGADGMHVAVAWPLRHFVKERGELTTRMAIVVVIGLLGSIALGILSAHRALRPLRETTAAIRAIDPRRLDARIPVRGTADDVDGLAVATNEVLARLEWAFDRLAGFSADAAHELRTPVNRLLTTAEVALTTTTDGAAKDDALATIHAAADAMRRTIEQLLLLARGEDGRLTLATDEVELGALVDGLVELYAPEAERLAKDLTVAPSPAAIVRADRDLLARAVANLLENALTHTERGAAIRVAVATDDGNAALIVEDSGAGIPPGNREGIFDRFVRLDGARTAGGAGLGLPIARMVARLHGGDLVVATSTLGGAAFRLTLPSVSASARGR